MTTSLLDTRGRLVEFHAVPPQRDTTEAAGPAPDWNALFALAELPRDRFTPAVPEWMPRTYADTRAAWVGTIPELGSTPVRLEAGAYRGRVTFFQTIGPWTRPERMEADPVDRAVRLFSAARVLILLTFLLGAALLARRNLALGRGDRAGARRVAGVIFAASLLSSLTEARHYADLTVEQNRFFQIAAGARFDAGLFWIIYLAMEPWVRRHWPDCLIGWSRLISRGFRDAFVGRDILAGAACGLSLSAYQHVARALRLLSNGVAEPLFGQYQALEGLRYIVSDAAKALASAPTTAVFFLLTYVVLRRILHLRVAAAVGFMLIFNVFIGTEGAFSGAGPLQFFLAFGYSLIFVATLLRFGLLAFLVMMFMNNLMHRVPWTQDVAAWYAPPMLVVVALTAAMTVFAFVQSRAGAPLFGKGLLEE